MSFSIFVQFLILFLVGFKSYVKALEFRVEKNDFGIYLIFRNTSGLNTTGFNNWNGTYKTSFDLSAILELLSPNEQKYVSTKIMSSDPEELNISTKLLFLTK